MISTAQALNNSARVVGEKIGRIIALEDALRMLITAYVATLEGGRDRILFLGGTCDDVPTMEASDPALRHAKRVLTANDGEVNGQ